MFQKIAQKAVFWYAVVVNQLLKQIRQLHWVWFWSGNWPLLDAILERNTLYEKEFATLAGITPRISVDFFQNGIIAAYHCQEEYDRLERHFQKRFAHASDFLIKSLKNYKKRTDGDLQVLRTINQKTDLRSLSNHELARIFLNARKHFAYNSAIDHYTWYLEKFFVPKLQESVQKSYAEAQIAEYVAILVTPRKPSRIFQERTAFFRIIKQVEKDKKLVNILKTKAGFAGIEKQNPFIAARVRKHHRKHCWLPVLVNSPPASLKGVWREIASFVLNEKHPIIESKRLGDNFDKAARSQLHKIIKRLNPSPVVRDLIRGLQEVAFARTEDNAVMSESSYLVIPLYQEIAKRLGVTYYQLKELNPEEVVGYLKKGKQFPTLEVNKRRRLSCYVVYRGKRLLLSGKKAAVLRKIVTHHPFTSEQATNVYKGVSASAGLYRGRVKIVLSSREAANIKTGDILVAPATSADFIPAMRKAGAIVTEFGGITSHAAVVSREFQIPCIVGVAGLTDKLKNGEIVEIDGSKGEIRRV